MSSNEKIWEKPDPRIQWALDILEPKGYEPVTIPTHFWYPTIFAAMGYTSAIFRNVIARRPITASYHVAIGAAVLGWLGGVQARDMFKDKNAEEIAVLKHYVMLHPEKFPEPEPKKFGDKEVFLEWPINR